jgi:hypothetical protein
VCGIPLPSCGNPPRKTLENSLQILWLEWAKCSGKPKMVFKSLFQKGLGAFVAEPETLAGIVLLLRSQSVETII